MSFDVQAECPTFFEDEVKPTTDQAANGRINGSSAPLTNGQASTSMTEAREDHLENIEDRQPKLSMRNGESVLNSSMSNQHYAQSFVKSGIKGKPMFSLHRHVKGGTIPCLAFDSLALETTFRMMKINFNVRYDVKKLNKPAYINHEGYLLTGIKKVLHYLNLRTKMGIDGHLTVVENSTVRAFATMLIDQTNFIVDFYRYQENFDGWKDVVRDSNHTTSKENSLKIIKNKKKSQKFIKQRMFSLGFYNWCEEGIKSVAKEDFKNLSQLLGEKQYFMGDVPCVLDCVAFAVIANIVCSNHTNPLVSILKNDCANLVAHYERVKELFWPDWGDQLNARSAQAKTSTARPKSFSYKRLSFRSRRAKSASVRSANVTPSKNQDPKVAVHNQSPDGSNAVEVTTKEDPPSGNETSPEKSNGAVADAHIDDKLLQKVNGDVPASAERAEPAEPAPATKPSRASLYQNLAKRCNFFKKPRPKTSPPTTDLSVSPTTLQSSNACTCGSNKNSATITSTPEIGKEQDPTNDKATNGLTIEESAVNVSKNDDEDFADALEDIVAVEKTADPISQP